MHIEKTFLPSSQDIDFLTLKIHEEVSGFGEWAPFGFFIKDTQGEIIAGCNGFVIFGIIYTDQLWVHPNHRKTGLGRQLMEQVHTYGSEKRCTMATVSTMSFQGALVFYEKLGYTLYYDLKGYIHDTSCYFLKLML
jgi:GNAT superfamily N-acetyltransferase